MLILTNIPSHTKNEIFFLFMVWIFSITLTKEVDFNQASPSYEVAMGISQGKEKSHGAHIWLLSTSPMAKMD